MQSTFGCRSLKQGRDWSGRDARRSRLQAPGRSHAPGQSAGERAPPPESRTLREHDWFGAFPHAGRRTPRDELRIGRPFRRWPSRYTR